MKKLVSLALSAMLATTAVAGLASCGGDDKTNIKVGFICLHDESSTYDLNFLNAAEEAVKNLKDKGIEVESIVKTNIGEDNTCYEEAASLAANGCDVVFANSFGH